MLDTDHAGQEATEKIAKRLGKWRCYVVELPHKDANECLVKGVALAEIFECIKNAKEFKQANIKRADEYIDDLIRAETDTAKRNGVPTAYDGLTKIIRGWRPQEVTIWSGRNSSGKTTMLSEATIDLLRRDEQTLVVSLEMTPKRLLRWMVVQAQGISTITETHIRQQLQTIGKNMYIMDVYGTAKTADIIDGFTYGARKYGIKHFIIDSLTLIEFKRNDEYKEQKQFMQELMEFAKDMDAHVHMVAHPRKSDKDEDRPGKVDIGGTGHITDLASNVLIVYRLTEEEKEKSRAKGLSPYDTVLYIRKNREWGTEGKVNFRFNDDNKRFIESFNG
jgi:twinkle protein